MDLVALCHRLFPTDEIVKLKYFTARVSAKKDDPDQPIRQNTYFRALGTRPEVEIIEGQFKVRRATMEEWTTRKPIDVLKTEEKGSDVNLASHLLMDGFNRRYEKAVVICNDADQITSTRMVQNELRLPVIVINPSQDVSVLRVNPDPKHPANQKLAESDLRACQFASPLQDAQGRSITKPSAWV